jgi:hypothetical protein
MLKTRKLLFSIHRSMSMMSVLSATSGFLPQPCHSFFTLERPVKANMRMCDTNTFSFHFQHNSPETHESGTRRVHGQRCTTEVVRKAGIRYGQKGSVAMTGQQGLNRIEGSSGRWRKVCNFFCYSTFNGFLCRKEEITEVIQFVPLIGRQSCVAPQQGLRHLVVGCQRVRNCAELGFPSELESVSSAMNQERSTGASLAMLCAQIGDKRG